MFEHLPHGEQAKSTSNVAWSELPLCPPVEAAGFIIQHYSGPGNEGSRDRGMTNRLGVAKKRSRLGAEPSGLVKKVFLSLLLMCASSSVCAKDREPEVMTITLVGQSMIRTDIRADVPDQIPAIKGLIKGDVAFTNFEAAVFDPSQGETVKSGRFVSPPGAMEALKDLGFNLLSLANNHAYDMKEKGVANGIDTANRLKIPHAGSGANVADATEPAYLQTPKGKVAMIAIASGEVGEGRATQTHAGVNELRVDNETINAEDAKRILDMVRRAKKSADIVIVSQHNHYFPGLYFKQMLLSELPERLEPPQWYRDWAHQLVDAGADILALHGTPILHGVELFKGKPIFYSLGNFIFQVPPESVHLEEPIMWESVVAYVDMTKDKVQAVRFVPIKMNKIGRGLPNPHDMYDVNEYHRTRGLPSPASGVQADYLLRRFARMSKALGTDVAISGNQAELLLPAQP